MAQEPREVKVMLPAPTVEELQAHAAAMKAHAERTGATYREVRDTKTGLVIMAEIEEPKDVG